MLYIGGLDARVTEHVLKAAFIPFGPIKEVEIPKDSATRSNKGFAFVQFEYAEDAAAARDNMDNAELYGRCLKVDISQQQKSKSKAVWHDADDWYRKKLTEEGYSNEVEAREAAKEEQRLRKE